MPSLTTLPTHDADQWLRLAARRVCLCVLPLVAVLMGAERASAAGCSYAHEEMNTANARAGALPRWTWWESGPQSRIYDGGRFHYFALGDAAPPCRGPRCEGSPSTPTTTAAAEVDTSRHTLPLANHDGSLQFQPPLGSRLQIDTGGILATPFHAGLLRPPRLLS